MKNIFFKLKTMMIKKNEFFDDTLIMKLNNEHQQLFSIYNDIITALEENNYSKALKLLKDFYYNYKLHIVTEDKQLYTYLLIKYRFVPETKELIERKQEEMTKITKFIEDFAKKYSNKKALQTEEFKEDLQTLARLLTIRVKFEEEKLYPLYFSNNLNAN